MTISKYIKTILLLCLLYCTASVNAQKEPPKLCGGNFTIDTAALNKAQRYELAHAGERLQVTSILNRVYFHILLCADGSNQAATEAQIASEFNTLLAAYAPANICFINVGLDYIYNSGLDTNFNGQTGDPSVFSPYMVPNCYNVFYLTKIKGNNTACSNNCGIGGTSLAIPNTFCLISSGNIGTGQSIAHEIGHDMGLFHTFEQGHGTEDIDGSNSTTNGDNITDTPADPYGYNAQPCFSTNGCLYNGTCKDPKNASNFTPPYLNLMAYWWSGNACYPSLSLTNGQYTRIISTLNSVTANNNCASFGTVTESNVTVTNGFHMVTAINTYTATTNVVITGTSQATIGGGNALLEPGFRATPSAGGLTLVRIRPCN